MVGDIIRDSESYLLQFWSARYPKWVIFSEYPDRAEAESNAKELLESDKRYNNKNTYRIVKKIVKEEIVYESGNDK